MHYELTQGGGWLGQFSWPIVKGLHEERGHPDERRGVSVGSINEYLAAAELWKVGDQFWAGIDDKASWNGIKGYLSVTAFTGDGWFSMKPLRKKLSKHVALDSLKVPYACGVVDRQLTYHTLRGADLKNDKHLVSAIVASCSMAAIMESVQVEVEGTRRKCNDGGHVYSLPRAPVAAGDKVTAILHHPIDGKVTKPYDGKGMKSSLAFVIGSLKRMTHERDVAWLKDLAEEGVQVEVYAPSYDLGDSLAADRPTLDMRKAEGLAALKAGPVKL